MLKKKMQMVDPDKALPGRETAMQINGTHYVNKHSIQPPFPAEHQQALFGMGCFWGAERKFWQAEGVYCTAAGYAGGYTKNPGYEEVCSGMTGHNEVVLVCWNPELIDFAEILRIFWESHDPTQGMRQGNDIGTQYRSGIYCSDSGQLEQANASRLQYQQRLTQAGYGEITTEILENTRFYYAEDYHQQYLAKNPGGYCGIGGTGVSC